MRVSYAASFPGDLGLTECFHLRNSNTLVREAGWLQEQEFRDLIYAKHCAMIFVTKPFMKWKARSKI